MAWRERLYARLSMSVAQLLRRLEPQEAVCLEEIRIRLHRPAELVFSGERRLMEFAAQQPDMDELVAALSGYALYAFERQMAQGYISLPGGHRAGVCGRMVEEQGKVVRMTDISSVNIRIARRIDGASRHVRRFLLDEAGRPRRVLMLGPPGCGKTTVLRDAAVYLSDHCALHVALADEREELYACGEAGKEGMMIDVMTGGSKAQMMLCLIRTLSPQVIITDEVGQAEDVMGMMEAARCGIGLLASAHSGTLEDIHRRPVLRRMAEEGVFERYILLGRHGVCLEAWDQEGRACKA